MIHRFFFNIDKTVTSGISIYKFATSKANIIIRVCDFIIIIIRKNMIAVILARFIVDAIKISRPIIVS